MRTTGEEPPRDPPAPVRGVERAELAAAANATTSRLINEAIEEGRATADGPIAFVCECGRLGCDALAELSLDEYEAVRGDARRFLVKPGHEQPDDVIDGRHIRYVVTSKRGSAGDAVLRADPRADGRVNTPPTRAGKTRTERCFGAPGSRRPPAAGCARRLGGQLAARPATVSGTPSNAPIGSSSPRSPTVQPKTFWASASMA